MEQGRRLHASICKGSAGHIEFNVWNFGAAHQRRKRSRIEFFWFGADCAGVIAVCFRLDDAIKIRNGKSRVDDLSAAAAKNPKRYVERLSDLGGKNGVAIIERSAERAEPQGIDWDFSNVGAPAELEARIK